jgi:protein-S-isoprenylcysteine O-methyltransferase Ste14
MKLNVQKERLTPFKILLKIPVPWVFVLTYLLGLPLQLIFSSGISNPEVILTVRIAGVILFAFGSFFAAWSLIIFHKASTTTTPGESSKKLVNQSPYRLSRNPMYVSLVLAYLGEAGFLTQVWPVVVLPLVIVYLNNVVIPLEEKILRRDFEDEYVEYCKRVRRWI